MAGKRLTWRRVADEGGSGKRWRSNASYSIVSLPRDFVTLGTVDHVAPPREGGVVVARRRGAREVQINVPGDLVPELIARLRRPV